MDSIFTTFLLFLAALTALLTYLIVPRMPVVALTSAASVALVAGVWWHWTQFSVDYRTSTWQESLRNYASYALLLVVILLSYGFYVFGWSGGSLQAYAQQAQGAVREATRKVTSSSSPAAATNIFGSVSGNTRSPSAAAATNTLFGSLTGSNTSAAGANANFLF